MSQMSQKCVWRLLGAVAVLAVVCVGSLQYAHATGEISGSICADGQNCSNCKTLRGTYYGSTTLHCFTSQGGTGGSAKVCIADSDPAETCQNAGGTTTVLTCINTSMWDCGAQNPNTGDCPTPCACSGAPTNTGGYSRQGACTS
jgi:hypothetical protein